MGFFGGSAPTFGGFFIPANGGPSPPAFLYFRSLTVDHAQVGVNLTDFPVLVSFTNNTFKTVANGGHVENANRYDIVFFSDADLTIPLDYEIESYDGSAGTIVMWVKLTLSGSVDTVFYMAYGNSDITTSQENVSGTWSNGYVAVYHLNQNAANTSVVDSLVTGNGTANVNTSTIAIAGNIDGAFRVTASQWVDLPAGSLNVSAKPLSLSAWIKCTTAGGQQGQIIGAYDPNSPYSGYGFGVGATTNGRVGAWAGGGGWAESNTGIASGAWRHCCAVLDSQLIPNWNFYLDGSSDGVVSYGPVLGYTGAKALFSRAVDHASPFGGSVDEIHIANVERSANWIAAEYNNQSSSSSFIVLGAEG